MDKITPKVYIVLNKGAIESIYSEVGYLGVAVLDIDTIHDETDEVRKRIVKWRKHLRKETFTGGTLYEIEYWDAKELLKY